MTPEEWNAVVAEVDTLHDRVWSLEAKVASLRERLLGLTLGMAGSTIALGVVLLTRMMHR